MPYFNLNYIAPITQNAIPCFTITETSTPLTEPRLESLLGLIHHIIENHLPCSSVPASFFFNPNAATNTILILQQAIFSILDHAQNNPYQPYNQAVLEELYEVSTSFIDHLNIISFQQALPAIETSPLSSTTTDISRKRSSSSPLNTSSPKLIKEHDCNPGEGTSSQLAEFLKDYQPINLVLSEEDFFSEVTKSCNKDSRASKKKSSINPYTLPITAGELINITPSENIVRVLPLFSIQRGRTILLAEHSISITIFTLKYEIFKKDGKKTDLFTLPRRRIRLTHKNIQRICSNSYHKKDLFRFIDPMSQQIKSITFPEAVHLIFEGLSENLQFLNETFPEILKQTPSNFPKSFLDKSIDLIKDLLPSNTPSIITPHILKDLLKTTQINKSESLSPTIFSEKIICHYFCPIFSIRVNQQKSYSSSAIECLAYTSLYEIKVSKKIPHKLSTKIRINIDTTEDFIKNLCTSSDSKLCSYQHQDPFTQQKTTINLSVFLLKTLEGLQENLLFLSAQFPLVLTETSIFNSKASLTNSITLVKNKLGVHAPKEDSIPYILKQLMTTEQENYNEVNKNSLTNDKFDHN
ncbi:hypothetical protein CLAVI_001023 [Candidatus Clavichlamydia salmonicola]|uniref:hypothetical protein n=1 Tax=Candidatus Clavichlamydia salmonicola TaxID=469812 RepID=UPI0018918D88|nr:hypothetical protein [Candidatus Clavichlamydia salmonicola]MBF5051379.1 hypothetical protein [Candidatus Clavichlamydia salmonicola]